MKTLRAALLPGTGFLPTKPYLFLFFLTITLTPLTYLTVTWWKLRSIPATAVSLLSNTPAFTTTILITYLLITLWTISLWVTHLTPKNTTVETNTGTYKHTQKTQGKLSATIAATTTILIITGTTAGTWYAKTGLDALNEVLAPTDSNSETTRVETPQHNSTTTTTTTTPATSSTLLNEPRTNILLLGSDAYPGRPGQRTDSMMLVSINNTTGNMTMISLPRNMERYQYRKTNPMYNLYPNGQPSCGLECMLNTVWEKTDEQKHLFPNTTKDPGLMTLKQVISDLTNQPIHRTIVINIRGFSDLIDALGGVTVNVPERLPIGGKIDPNTNQPTGITGWIEPGQNKQLNGYEAMWYARSRVLSDDYARTARQRCMVKAISKQANPQILVTNFPQIAKATGSNVKSDITRDDLPALAEIGERVKNGKTVSLGLSLKNISITHPNYDEIHKLITDKLTAADKTEPTTKPKSPTTTQNKTNKTTPTKPPTVDPNDSSTLYTNC